MHGGTDGVVPASKLCPSNSSVDSPSLTLLKKSRGDSASMACTLLRLATFLDNPPLLALAASRDTHSNPLSVKTWSSQGTQHCSHRLTLNWTLEQGTTYAFTDSACTRLQAAPTCYQKLINVNEIIQAGKGVLSGCPADRHSQTPITAQLAMA